MADTDTATTLYRGLLDDIRAAGLYKEERVITTPQDASIAVEGPAPAPAIPPGDEPDVATPREVINFCANNYLGLANHPDLIAAAKEGLDQYGFGLASVRFICGTQTIHKTLEERIARFHGKDDAILYTSCFDANAGLFETLLGEDDAVISDALNHASIIDGVRLCKARRFRFSHADMGELETALQESQKDRLRLITTDGVFSMDGDVAKLDAICDLAERYDALVHVDESHATGFFGPGGRGAADFCGVLDRVHIITSTLGKALGGASGGFTTASEEVVALLRQRSRPYLFSNTVAPAIVNASIRVLEMLDGAADLRERLMENTRHFRERMTAAGFDIRPGVHPIVPIMLYDAKLAQDVARDLLEEGIYVIGFSYPVVPQGQARIRVQVSAAHTREHLDRAVEAFTAVGLRHGVVPG
ncbi:MAG TPA: glycine C-acetyltransferase [Rubricoccaceae bacterium]|nr:glycine C-acetyltransferase [Rubricoccaceae bacterium]